MGTPVLRVVPGCGHACATNTELYPGYTRVQAAIDDQEFIVNCNPYVFFDNMTRSMSTLVNVTIITEWAEVVRSSIQGC